jgi:hypothetical protein
MQPANKFQDYKFNGKGAYSQQLDHVSLVDGYDDTFVGLNAGTKVILGGSSQQNTAVVKAIMVCIFWGMMSPLFISLETTE